jgi:hypothetical protein
MFGLVLEAETQKIELLRVSVFVMLLIGAARRLLCPPIVIPIKLVRSLCLTWRRVVSKRIKTTFGLFQTILMLVFVIKIRR